MTTVSHASPSATVALSDRRWLALVFIALAQLMLALDATIVNIALPSAQAALRISDTDRQWVVTAYTLAFGGLLLVGGRVADSRLGRKRAFLLGLGGFALASAIGGAAPNLEVLIVARALQGAFAALLAPTALSLLAVTFSQPEDRARAFGVYGAIAGGGGAMGLVLGGLLAQYLDWRWCLFVNLPIAAIAALGAWLFLASTATPSRKARFALVPLYVVLDGRRGPAYLSVVLAIAGMFGAFLFLTYELQVVLGFAPLIAGLAFLPLSTATLIGSAGIASRLLPRVGPRALMVPGFVCAAAGMAVLSQLQPSSGYLTTIVPAEVLLGLGIACVMMPASSTATSGVDQRDAGIASATLNTAQQAGASLGTAVLNTLAASVTQAYLAAAGGPRTEGLVHGYAAAAALGVVLLLAGAAVSATLRDGRGFAPSAVS
jgi:MFS family permease